MRFAPKAAQEALARIGGRNLQGKPIWKFIWSADFKQLISTGEKYEAVRVVSDDTWLLVKWESSEPTSKHPNGFWGTEEEWRYNNLEFPSGLMTAGPFPREGRYRVMLKLRAAFMDGDTLVVEGSEPSVTWVENIFPMILEFDHLDDEEKAKVLAERERSKRQELMKSFKESRKLYKGVATAKQIKEKEEAIERWIAKNPKGYNAKQPSL